MEENNKQQSNQESNNEGQPSAQPEQTSAPQPEPQQSSQSEQQQTQQSSGTEKVQQDATEETPKAGANDVQDNKAITYLSYLGILFLVPMLAKKDSPFAQFHAKQGLVLTIGWFLGSFLYVVFGLGALVHLAVIVFSIMGLVNVSKGEMKDLPFIGDLAKKFNF